MGMSTKEQDSLLNIFQKVIEETLEDAKKIAIKNGKDRITSADVEEALKRTCGSYYRARYNLKDERDLSACGKEYRKTF